MSRAIKPERYSVLWVKFSQHIRAEHADQVDLTCAICLQTLQKLEEAAQREDNDDA